MCAAYLFCRELLSRKESVQASHCEIWQVLAKKQEFDMSVRHVLQY